MLPFDNELGTHMIYLDDTRLRRTIFLSCRNFLTFILSVPSAHNREHLFQVNITYLFLNHFKMFTPFCLNRVVLLDHKGSFCCVKTFRYQSKRIRKEFQATSLSSKGIRDTSSAMKHHPSTIVAHYCFTSVKRQALITLHQNSLKSGDNK